MEGSCNERNFNDIRRGPWTLEEDNLLIRYISYHGEGRWNLLAKSSGLKRSGKSCRLRWLNYLKPDIKRGNLTSQEQLLILELHSKWGNRWSKIACHLPGRTDNEIKNYWRTRVQKQARHLKIDANSKRFVETVKRFWMPRLLEKVEQNSSLSLSSSSSSSSTFSTSTTETNQNNLSFLQVDQQTLMPSPSSSSPQPIEIKNPNIRSSEFSSDSIEKLNENSNIHTNPNEDINYYNSSLQNNNCYHVDNIIFDMGFNHLDMQAMGPNMSALEGQMAEGNWMNDDELAIASWNIDELWHFSVTEHCTGSEGVGTDTTRTRQGPDCIASGKRLPTMHDDLFTAPCDLPRDTEVLTVEDYAYDGPSCSVGLIQMDVYSLRRSF